MDIGFSCLLSDFIEPSQVDPLETKRLSVVCPECREPVNKVVSKGVHFFVHASHKNPCYTALQNTQHQHFFSRQSSSRAFFKHVKKSFIATLSARQQTEFLLLLKSLRKQRFASEWLLFKDFVVHDKAFVASFFEKTIMGVARKRRLAQRVYDEILKSNALWYFFGVLSILNYYNILESQLHGGFGVSDAQVKMHKLQQIVDNTTRLESDEYHVFLLNIYQTLLFCLSKMDFRQLVMDVNRDRKRSHSAGYVYILHNPEHQQQTFKVGRTQVSVRDRAKSLSNTAVLYDFEVIDEWYTVDCFRSERAIHQALADYRVRESREFFQVDLETIRMAIEQNLVD